MIIYRPHRGGLAQSLPLAKEFQTEAEMKEYIYEQFKRDYDSAPFEVKDIVVDRESSTDDGRCGWHDTMYVCVKRYGNENYMKKYGAAQCIGMCATDYRK